MSNLRLKLLGKESITNAPVHIEVINSEMESVAELSILVNRNQDIQLQAGKYLIQANLPSGKIIKTKTYIEENQHNEVVLPLISSTNQQLKWYEFLGNTYTWTIEQKITQIPSIWLRLWSHEQKTWKVKRLPNRWDLFEKWPEKSNLLPNEIAINFPLELSENQLLLLEIGGSTIPSFFIALPPKSHLEILVRPLENEPKSCEITVAVTSHNNQEAETLLSYLISGNIRAAKVVGNKLVERLLSEKDFEKLEAAISGYFLLKIGDDERLAQWVNKFVNLIEWLPDISVIHSWFLLREDNITRVKLARSSLLKAIKQGIPVCTEGMRLLFDGLLLFNQDALTRHEEDVEIKEALELIRKYVTTTDWSKPLTTFYGAAPELSSITGIPEKNTTGLVWLTLPTDNKWSLVQDILSLPFEGRVLKSLDLSDTGLSDANLTGADLTDANLSGADLTDANLSGADLSGADLINANLSGANLSDTDFTDANLSGADLTDADLTDANLTRANLTRANLTRANLSGADLSDADLSDTDFTDADFQSAILSETSFNNLQKARTSTSKDRLRDLVFVTNQCR